MKKPEHKALCQWFHPQRDYENDCIQWKTYDDKPEVCRASVGEKIVTVWLPQGAKIRMRRSRINPDDLSFRHYYGSYERGNRTRIHIDVVPS